MDDPVKEAARKVLMGATEAEEDDENNRIADILRKQYFCIGFGFGMLVAITLILGLANIWGAVFSAILLVIGIAGSFWLAWYHWNFDKGWLGWE